MSTASYRKLPLNSSTPLPSAALGDALADYVDEGHGVVVASFTTTFYVPLGGRWASGGYDAVQPSDYAFGPLTLGAVAQPDHPIMAGVASFDGGFASYHSVGGLTPGAALIASWSDGDVLVAEKSSHDVALNFFPVSSDVFSFYGWDSSTQGALLMGNALKYVSGFGVAGTTPAAGSTVSAPPSQYVVNVGGPVAPDSLDASDFEVNGLPATGVS
jgi:hypothetical protein